LVSVFSVGLVLAAWPHNSQAQEPAPTLTIGESPTPSQEQPAAAAVPLLQLANEAPPRAIAAEPALQLRPLEITPLGPELFPCEGASARSRTAANYLWPLLDVVAINLTMWAVPYALDVPFAQIGPSYWKHNFQTGFQWDDNEFEVNQFGHP
jgi:hypothetical protein